MIYIIEEIKKEIVPGQIRFPRNRVGLCRSCRQQYFYKDPKSQHCEDCLTTVVVFKCACGCGKTARKLKKEFIKRPYIINHDKRGKKYVEIYGTDNPSCGFKKGKRNPNYDITLKEKSTESLKRFYYKNPIVAKERFERLKKAKRIGKFIDNSSKEVFNSSYELIIYNFLKEKQFIFSREIPVPLSTRRFKVVDFIIFDIYCDIYIEVTGMSFAVNPSYFIERISTLKQIIGDSPPLIITSTALLKDVKRRVMQLEHTSIFVETIGNLFRVYSLITLCSIINSGNFWLQQIEEI